MRDKLFRSCLTLAIPMAAALVMGVPEIKGAGGSWNVDASGDWSTAGNWTPVGIPGTSAGDVINLNNDITATTTVTIDTTPRTAGILNLGDANGSHLFVLAASGGGYLTLDNGGNQAQVNLGAGGNVNVTVLSVPLRITTGGLLINNISGGNRLVSGSISTDTTGFKLITVNSGGGNTTLTGDISDGAGQIGILWDAGGVGFFNGNNTFTGGLTVRRGSVRVGVNGGTFGTGTVTLGDASSGNSIIQISTGTSSGNSATISNNIVVSSSATGTVQIVTPTAGSDITYSGDMDIQRNIIFRTGGASYLNFSGDLSGAGNIALETGGLNPEQSTMTLSGDNSGLTGNISTHNNVHFRLGHEKALGTGTVDLGGENLRLSSTVADLEVDSSAVVNANVDFAFIGDHDLTIKNAVVLGSNRVIDVADERTLTLAGNVSGTFSGLTKEGEGTLALNGVNTYDGETAVNAGILQGSGSVAGNVYIEADAILSNAGGTFTIGGDELGFSSGAAFHFSLDTTTALASQIIADSVFLDEDVMFSLNEIGTTLLTAGTIFTAIDSNFFDGEFMGLTEGEILNGGVNLYKVSYLDDKFTLQVVPEPGICVLISVGLISIVFRRHQS